MPREVARTPELARVLDLPRRTWDDDPGFAERLTAALAAGRRGMKLRPNQAQALYEIASLGGAVLPMRVGSGKTLISALAPTVLRSERPLVVVPAMLREKTHREFCELAEHFKVSPFIRIESYEMIGRVASRELLASYGPDLIVADEAHRLKNPDAGVTKRVRWYLEQNPACRFVAMSGTITRTSILDFAHLLLWALGAPNAPLPMSTLNELQTWASYLDAKDTDTEPGALIVFAEPGGDPLRTRIRKGYQRRLTETPGVVATHDSPTDIGCSLTIRHLRHEHPAEITRELVALRNTWQTPDAWPLFDGKDVARHARELALGFFYKWDPRPPKDWLEARKAWSSTCRAILKNNGRQIATQEHLVMNLEHYPAARPFYDRWKEIEPTFTPNTVPVWISDWAIELAKDWIRENDGIVWTEHAAFARRLERASGAPYYGAEGKNSAGQPIEKHNPRDGACIASIKANSTGRNLQAWNRSLIVSPGLNAALWEQNLGRLHRDGQKADEVIYDVFMLCDEHRYAWDEALAMSRYEQEITGQEQKLVYANLLDGTP